MAIAKYGMSLMEVMISLAIFSAVMVAVLQSLATSTNYVEFDEARNNVHFEEMRFQSLVINDLANAAWFFQFDPVADQSFIDPVTKGRVPLFPKVSTDHSTIQFIKLRTSLTVANTPAGERYSFTNFKDSGHKPVDFTQYVDAVPTPLMVMNPDYRADPQWFVASAWETNNVGLTFDQNQDPAFLRQYRYAIETDATGVRNLVRSYRYGDTGAWTLDEVLVPNVISAEFLTKLEDASINENQVRVSVLIERSPQSSAQTGVKVQKRIEFTASMRSINQEN